MCPGSVPAIPFTWDRDLYQINAHAELVRPSGQAVGVIRQFNDESPASQRKMKVEFQSDDASVHSTWATVDS